MDKYYYFASQLPSLSFKQNDFPSKQFFLEEAEKWLNKKDLDVIVKLNLDNYKIKDERLSFLKKWIDFENNLRTEISKYRKARSENYKFTSRMFSSSILKEKTPLQIEVMFLQFRWDFIEEMEFGHYSDLEFLVLYYLRIQILERLSLFNKDKGKEKFNELITINKNDSKKEQNVKEK
ncbi:MAG: DUF2764 family protein [Candidatus Marinimicrobia bacterium]|nr:DUF2764 family protein [Candidatus Neomarinimicrobiota bacterium]